MGPLAACECDRSIKGHSKAGRSVRTVAPLDIVSATFAGNALPTSLPSSNVLICPIVHSSTSSRSLPLTSAGTALTGRKKVEPCCHPSGWSASRSAEPLVGEVCHRGETRETEEMETSSAGRPELYSCDSSVLLDVSFELQSRKNEPKDLRNAPPPRAQTARLPSPAVSQRSGPPNSGTPRAHALRAS